MLRQTKILSLGVQVNAHAFKLNDTYYRGRIEEARRDYLKNNLDKLYSFNQYVESSYLAINKPKLEIKQEIIGIISPTLESKEMVKVLFLLDKL